MYRIKIKDVEIETDSAQEASHFVQMIQKNVAKSSSNPLQPVTRKATAHRTYYDWTRDQFFFLLDNLDMEFKYLSKRPELIPHTVKAIDSMRSNVKNQSPQMGARTMGHVKEYWKLQGQQSN